jgi:hypothetical protein
MEESVPNRPYRSHDDMDQEAVKRTKGSEQAAGGRAVEDIRGRFDLLATAALLSQVAHLCHS